MLQSVDETGTVGILRLNRPRALNALSSGLLVELYEALQYLDSNDRIRAIVLTGGEKVFSGMSFSVSLALFRNTTLMNTR